MKNVLALSIAIAFASVSGLALADHFPPKDGTAPPAVKSADPSTTTAATRSADSGNAVRDWAKVDANKDHSISPEEMEAYLLANRAPLKGK